MAKLVLLIQRREILMKKMSMEVKKMILKAIMWRVVLYACETWALRLKNVKNLEAFDMWI